jgi:predicted DCC family thiol-disulfide oxidoreductase YuxK
MSSDENSAIIVFDGVCSLCNGWIRFLLRHDRERRYRFAAMQATTGRALLQEHGLDPDDPTSFLLLDREGVWTDTDAIGRVLAGLGLRWRVLAKAVAMVPQPLRDAGYRVLARNRYRWFGRKAHCHVPAPDERDRFID